MNDGSYGARIALFGALVLTACHDSSEPPLGRPDTTELGFDAATFRLVDGVLAAGVPENGHDLDGDGDGNDMVLEIVELATGIRTPIPHLARLDGALGATADSVTFLVAEADAGRDLDGDFDTDDLVLHVHHLDLGITQNTGLATFGLQQAGRRVAFGVWEAVQGVDLDGDGELLDAVLHVYDGATRRATSLALPISPESIRVDGDRVITGVREHPGVDIDQNGDTDGYVPIVHDAGAGTTWNAGLTAGVFPSDGALLAIEVDESSNHNTDLNGNGHIGDVFVRLHDLSSGTARTTSSWDATVLGVGGDVALLWLNEPPASDGVWLYDRLTDALFPVHDAVFEAPGAPALADRRLAYVLDEARLGIDLDGDGEARDEIVHVLDARTGVARSLGRATFAAPRIDARHVVYLGLTGSTDVRPPTHTRVQVQDVSGGTVRDIGLTAFWFELVDERILALAGESWDEVDLNGDGDLQDGVLQVYDLRTDRRINTGLEPTYPFSESFALDGDRLVVRTSVGLVAVSL